MAGKNRRNQKREDKSKDTSIITLPIKKRIIEVPRRERNSLHLINSNGESFYHCQICNREFKDLIYHNCPKNYQEFVVPATQAASGQKKMDFIARREFGENNTKYNSCSEQIETRTSRIPEVCAPSKQIKTRTSRNPTVCAPSKQMKNNTPRNIWFWAPSKKIKTRDPRACIPSKQLKSIQCNCCNDRFYNKKQLLKHSWYNHRPPTLRRLTLQCIQALLQEAPSKREIDECNSNLDKSSRMSIVKSAGIMVNQKPPSNFEEPTSFSRSGEMVSRTLGCSIERGSIPLQEEVGQLKKKHRNWYKYHFDKNLPKHKQLMHVPQTLLKMPLRRRRRLIQALLKEAASSKCEIDENNSLDKRASILVNQEPPSDFEDPTSSCLRGEMVTRASRCSIKWVRIPSNQQVKELKRVKCNHCKRRFKFEIDQKRHARDKHNVEFIEPEMDGLVKQEPPAFEETATIKLDIDENNSSNSSERPPKDSPQEIFAPVEKNSLSDCDINVSNDERMYEYYSKDSNKKNIPKKQEMFVCQYCNRHFTDQYDLQWHRSRDKICNMCGLQFCYKRQLFQHVSFYHKVRQYNPNWYRRQYNYNWVNKYNKQEENLSPSAERYPLTDVALHRIMRHPMTSHHPYNGIDPMHVAPSCTAEEGLKKEYKTAELFSASSIKVEPTSTNVKVEPTFYNVKVEPTEDED